MTTTQLDTLRIALVGTPNCGKTSLFNALTGSRQRATNYPGVTVEKKSGRFTTADGKVLTAIDLPGTYSLRGRSPDEAITRDMVLGRVEGEDRPDLLLCVADATNMRLTIRLALELKRTGQPIMLVLNMMDLARHRGIGIDMQGLQEMLGMPVVTAVAIRTGGTAELLAALDERLRSPAPEAGPSLWEAPTSAQVREDQIKADAILRACVTPPKKPDTLTTRFDAIALHPVFGMMLLLAVLFLMFQAVFTGAQPLMQGLQSAFEFLGQIVRETVPEGLLQSFLQNGVIAGVGSVIVFLPQIVIVFLFILVLEDFGYMARAAFLMDKIMGGAGLHGRAFIPLLSSFACAIPGIMSARVVDQRRDRLTTILIAPLMTCSARIPVYTLLISAFVPDHSIWGVINLQGLVMFGLYAAGIFSALAVSLAAKLIMWRHQPPSPFMLELPDYKLPRLKSVAIGIYTRAMNFLERAGTTIFAMMVLIWFLASFPQPPEGASDPAIAYSLAASIGHFIEPVLAPLGFNWQISVALVPGMAAREVAVAALGTVYSIEGGKEASAEIAQMLAQNWSIATGLALIAWYIFAPQCASTLAVIRRETGSAWWMLLTFVYMLALAYVAAFATYRIACAFGLG